MIKVAITGNIAAGKSEVERFLMQNNFKVADTDIFGHQVLEDYKDLIVESFRPYDILEDGIISRKKLGNIVFDTPVLKKKLESIVHPIIKQKILEFFEKNRDEEFVFVGIPLLYEANMQDLFDKVLLVYSNDRSRLKRLMIRNHLTKSEAKLRMDAQMSQDKKRELADFVVYNNRSIESLEGQVRKLFFKH